mmetsp:Transcript_5013/g.10559  ORF Transcript_5013/g.10559 Transcript_5013/m.10559 type:complete len:571 (-) Transcript_5013:327-2039(-)
MMVTFSALFTALLFALMSNTCAFVVASAPPPTSTKLRSTTLNGKGKSIQSTNNNGRNPSRKADLPDSLDSSNLEGPSVAESAFMGGRGVLTRIGDSLLPTPSGTFRIRAYRHTDPDGHTTEPCVIYMPPPSAPEDAPFSGSSPGTHVRLHDQCFTSETLGSLRCDCASQLAAALTHISETSGAVVYMMQEGRGIGLANKIAAYQLQDGGLDTVDANHELGLPAEARSYAPVPGMLQDLGIDSITILTNNPFKIQSLSDLGVSIAGREKLEGEYNSHNTKYLQTKVDRMSHMLDNVLPSPRRNGRGVPGTAFPPREDAVGSGGDDSTSASDDPRGSNSEGVVPGSDGYCFGRKSVEDCIAAIGRGELVCVVDDMSRENEGDLILSASLATPATVARMVRHTSGVLCVAMEGDTMDRLDIGPMVEKNEDPKGTAFGVSVDATSDHGITTGISARDRAATINLLGAASVRRGSCRFSDEEPTVAAADFVRPGHIFPLRAREGGVLTRDGHTEASVDLPRLAGQPPAGVLCEIVSEREPGEMARLPELREMCEKEGWVLTSIADLQAYRKEMGV